MGKEPAKTNIKIKDPLWKDLHEATLGPLGFGFPAQLTGYQLVGEATGLLAALFERNDHMKTDFEGPSPDPDGLAWSEMSMGFWDRLVQRLDEIYKRNGRWRWITTWYPKRGLQVHVFEDEDGGRYYIPEWYVDTPLEFLFRSRAARMRITSTKAEVKARERLNQSLNGRQRRELLLTDNFEEIGRSGVHYLIRANRPTIAFRLKKARGRLKRFHFLAAMCLHPLGYYEDTFTGCLPPSDEMLAHLLLIRADEHFFWRKCGQHGVANTRSGI